MYICVFIEQWGWGVGVGVLWNVAGYISATFLSPYFSRTCDWSQTWMSLINSLANLKNTDSVMLFFSVVFLHISFWFLNWYQDIFSEVPEISYNLSKNKLS